MSDRTNAMPGTDKTAESKQTPSSPSITVRLGIERIVFLITEIQELPELDAYPAKECTMRFSLLPGILLTSSRRQIVYPLLLDHDRILPGKVQVLQAAMEHENPSYGLSMFAKVLALPEYMELVPSEISAHLPYELARIFFPNEAARIVITDDMLPLSARGKLGPRRVAALKQKLPIKVNFAFPSGYPLPQLYRGKIVRISLSLFARAGGLSLNDRSPMLINSLSRPTRIYAAPAGFETPADDYYQLRSIGSGRPVTSELPDFYEDYTEMLDPTAAYLARRGIKP